MEVPNAPQCSIVCCKPLLGDAPARTPGQKFLKEGDVKFDFLEISLLPTDSILANCILELSQTLK